LAVLVSDPDPYWECGSGLRSMEIDQNKHGFLLLKKAFVPTQVRYVFDLLPNLIFHIKIQLSCDF
jgi:hypothetical protein